MAPAARLWYTLKGACGVSPLYETGYKLRQKVVVEECGEKHASQLALKSKQIFLQRVSPGAESTKQRRASLT